MGFIEYKYALSDEKTTNFLVSRTRLIDSYFSYQMTTPVWTTIPSNAKLFPDNITAESYLYAIKTDVANIIDTLDNEHKYGDESQFIMPHNTKFPDRQAWIRHVIENLKCNIPQLEVVKIAISYKIIRD